MSIKFCALCERNVDAKRKIGVGTLIMVLVTAGFWLLAIPFYSKRCPVCTGSALHNQRTDSKKVSLTD